MNPSTINARQEITRLPAVTANETTVEVELAILFPGISSCGNAFQNPLLGPLIGLYPCQSRFFCPMGLSVHNRVRAYWLRLPPAFSSVVRAKSKDNPKDHRGAKHHRKWDLVRPNELLLLAANSVLEPAPKEEHSDWWLSTGSQRLTGVSAKPLPLLSSSPVNQLASDGRKQTALLAPPLPGPV